MFLVLKKYHNSPVGVAIDHPHSHLSPVRENLTLKKNKTVLFIISCSEDTGGGHGNPLQHPCLQNPMNRGVWRTTVHRCVKSQTWLKRLSTTHAVNLQFICPFYVNGYWRCSQFFPITGNIAMDTLVVHMCSVMSDCL